jgi:hypothetical protein
MPKLSPLPEPFGPSGADLWREIADEFDLSVAERLLLTAACRTADRLDRLHAEADGAPLVLEGRTGSPVANPLLVEARQQSVLLSRLVASLRVPEAAQDGQERRPQRRGAARRAYAPRTLKVV